MSAQEQDLEWIPRVMRDRLDACAVRISLKQWQALPLTARQTLARLAQEQVAVDIYKSALIDALQAADAGTPRAM